MAEARDPNKVVESLVEGSSGDAEVDTEIRRRWEGSAHKGATPPIARP